MPVLSSPNGVVWKYYRSLSDTVLSSESAGNTESARRHAAQAFSMAVTLVEDFLNLWFRVRVGELPNSSHQPNLKQQLNRRISLERKLRDWPRDFHGKSLDLTTGPGLEFSSLKALRNAIEHFTNTHENFKFDGVVIRGLADTSDYNALDSNVARWAIEVAESLITEVFRLADVRADRIPHALHAWLGKMSA